MIKRVISGGQTGADQAGWRAAKRFGIPTGGWMPKGFLAEDGLRPEFAELYGARESISTSYRDRTVANIEACDSVLWFGDRSSAGGKLTIRLCDEFQRWKTIIPVPDGSEKEVASHLSWLRITHLMVAGNRESKSPGIGAWVEDYLCEVFRLLNFQEKP